VTDPTNEELINDAAGALNPRMVGGRLFGDVGCALITRGGNLWIYFPATNGRDPSLSHPASGAVPSSSMSPSSVKNPSPSMGKITRTSLPGKLEATNSAARLMLVARTGTVKAPDSPLTSTDKRTKARNLQMGVRGAKMRWEK
jgi:hypothetical protein